MELFAAQSVCCAGKRKTGKPKSILWRAWQEEVVEDTTCDNALGKIRILQSPGKKTTGYSDNNFESCPLNLLPSLAPWSSIRNGVIIPLWRWRERYWHLLYGWPQIHALYMGQRIWRNKNGRVNVSTPTDLVYDPCVAHNICLEHWRLAEYQCVWRREEDGNQRHCVQKCLKDGNITKVGPSHRKTAPLETPFLDLYGEVKIQWYGRYYMVCHLDRTKVAKHTHDRWLWHAPHWQE